MSKGNLTTTDSSRLFRLEKKLVKQLETVEKGTMNEHIIHEQIRAVKEIQDGDRYFDTNNHTKYVPDEEDDEE